jgi:hypothetical protein
VRTVVLSDELGFLFTMMDRSRASLTLTLTLTLTQTLPQTYPYP